MSTAYPLPRQTRETTLTAAAGQTVFGPLDFILFDAADVEVWAKAAAAASFTQLGTNEFTVAPAAPATALPATFTVTLVAARGAADQVIVRGSRVGSRTTDVTRAGRLQSQPLETELDRQVATEQELRRDVSRLITQTPIDGAAILTDAIAARDAAAASAAVLANQVQQYDTRAQAAAATIPVGVTSIRIMRYAAGYPVCPAVYVPGTVAGPVAFQEAGGHWWELDVSTNVLLLPWFGANGGGVVADTAAVQAALNAAANKRLDGLGLTYNITSTLAGVAGVKLDNATLVQGAHPAAHPIINFVDKSGWQLRRIWFKSDYPTTLDYGTSKIGAVQFSNSTANALSGIAIEDCTFSDFADNYWVMGQITGAGSIDDFRFCGNLVLSTGLGNGANYQAQFHSLLNLFGSGASNTGIFVNPAIEDNAGDFTDLTVGLALWSRNKGAKVLRNRIRNVAATSTFSGIGLDTNCYGILVYDTIGAGGNITSCGLDGEIAHNYILNPPSAGIYFAAAQGWNVHDNHIIGQFRTDDASLPRAAISLNDCRKSRVHHNFIEDCWGGVAVVTLYGSDTVEVSDNHIYGSAAADAYGVRAGPSVGTATTSTIAIARNTIRLTGATARGVRTLSDAGNKYGTLLIEGNDIVAQYRAVELNAIYCVNKAVIRGNRYGGVLSGGGLSANSISGAVIIQGETFDLGAATGYGMVLDASTVQVNAIQFNGKTAGSECISAVGTLGSIEGVSFRGTTAALRISATSSLGYTTPTIAGAAGDFIQNVGDNFTEQGGAGSKFIVRGWSCAGGTTWLPHRELTGN